MKKRFSEEQIVKILGEAAGHGMAATARKYNISEQTLYVWRRRFEGMEVRQVVELKRLQQENARLKKLVAERDLELEVVKEIVAKNSERAGATGVCAARGTIRGKPSASMPDISYCAFDVALRSETPVTGGGAGCVDAHGSTRAARLGLSAGMGSCPQSGLARQPQSGTPAVAEVRTAAASTGTAAQAHHRREAHSRATDAQSHLVL